MGQVFGNVLARWFYLMVCLKIVVRYQLGMQLSEGLTGIGVSTLRLFTHVATKLVFALGKGTNFLSTWTSACFLGFLTRWWLEFKGKI